MQTSCNDKCLTPTELDDAWTLTNGLQPLGGIIGGLSSGFIGDTFGRRLSMISVNFFVLLTVALNVMSKFIPSYQTLMAGRFVSGLFSGLFSGLIPVSIMLY